MCHNTWASQHFSAECLWTPKQTSYYWWTTRCEQPGNLCRQKPAYMHLVPKEALTWLLSGVVWDFSGLVHIFDMWLRESVDELGACISKRLRDINADRSSALSIPFSSSACLLFICPLYLTWKSDKSLLSPKLKKTKYLCIQAPNVTFWPTSQGVLSPIIRKEKLPFYILAT